MSRKISQHFLPSTLGFTVALGLLVSASAQATTPVKTAETNGTMPPPAMMKKPSTVKMQVKPGTIVEVASSLSDFSTLVAAVKAAGLVNTLSGPGPFTVFAPTNEAFAKLPAGTVENLLKPENKAKLTKILTYHVVSGKVPSTAITPGAVKTVEGSTANIQIRGGKILINKAQVIKADVPATNGVIHVIDTVILPPNL